MTILTGHAAELVEMRICMTLVAEAVNPCIYTFCLVTAYAADIVMDPLQFQAALFFMVKPPGLPVILGMTAAAFLLKFPFVDILMTVFAFFSL